MDLTTYDDVNRTWNALQLPPITTKAAAPIFVKLVRKFGGRKMRLPRGYKTRRLYAAPKGSDTRFIRRPGLPALVHDASHWVFSELHPTFKTHSAAHAELERQMIEHVLVKGLHQPPTKTPPTVDAIRATKLANIEMRIRRWEAKAKRAATALKKLRAKQKRLHAASLR